MGRQIMELKTVRDHGGSKIVRVTEECRRFGLDAGDAIFVVTSVPDDAPEIVYKLGINDGFLYFVIAKNGEHVIFEERAAISESRLAESLGEDLIAVLGPFETLKEAKDFKKCLLDEHPEPTEGSLKEFLKIYES